MIAWKIDSLETRISDAEIAAREAAGPVVVRATWRVTAQDGQHTASVSGVQEFKYDPETDFTPYDALTEAQVLAWVYGAMGGQRESYEDMVRQKLEQTREAPISLPLPWTLPVSPILPLANDSLIGGNGNDTIGGAA